MAEIPNNQLRLVVFPIIYRFQHHPRWLAGLQPSTVSAWILPCNPTANPGRVYGRPRLVHDDTIFNAKGVIG